MTWTPWNRTRSVGFRLLGIWLIAGAVVPLLHLEFPYSGWVMSILAIAAGVCILLGR